MSPYLYTTTRRGALCTSFSCWLGVINVVKDDIITQSRRAACVQVLEFHVKQIIICDTIKYRFIEDFGKVYRIAEAETKRYGYRLSGHSLQLFCIEIITASTRSTMGYKMEESSEIKEELKPIIIALGKEFKENMNVRLPENEWLNL